MSSCSPKRSTDFALLKKLFGAFKKVSTFVITLLMLVLELVLIPVQVYYEMCWTKGNRPAGMLSLVLFSILAPEGSVGVVVYFVRELVDLIISSIVYFLENPNQLIKLIVLLVFAAFATDAVFYSQARSRTAVAEEASAIRARNESLDQQMTDFEDWRTAEIQKMNDWRQTVIDWRNGEEQRIDDLEEASKHWQSLHGKLESEHEEMGQRILLAEKASQAAVNKAQTMEEENASLKRKTSIAQRKQKECEHIVRDVKGREDKIRSENADLKTEIGQLTEMIAKLSKDELKRALETVTIEKDLYWEEGCKLMTNFTAVTDERDKLRDQLSGMTTHRDHLQQKLNDAIAAGTSFQNQLSDMTAHRDRLQQKLNDASAQRDTLQNQLTEMTGHRDRLQKELNDAIAKHNALQKQLSEMTAHRDQLQQKLKGAIAQRDALQNELSEMTANRNALQNQLSEMTAEREVLQHEHNKVVAERDMLLWKVDELEKEDSERAKKVNNANTDRAKARGQATDLRAKLAEARREIEALKGAGGSGGNGTGAGGDVPIDPALSNA